MQGPARYPFRTRLHHGLSHCVGGSHCLDRFVGRTRRLGNFSDHVQPRHEVRRDHRRGTHILVPAGVLAPDRLKVVADQEVIDPDTALLDALAQLFDPFREVAVRVDVVDRVRLGIQIRVERDWVRFVPPYSSATMKRPILAS